MDRLHAWNHSRVGLVLVVAFLGVLLLTGHGQVVIYIGAAGGCASYIVRRRGTRDTQLHG